jgi:hypothetical protein
MPKPLRAKRMLEAARRRMTAAAMTLATSPAITEPTSTRAADTADVRRPTEHHVALAIDLGWRMAELYAIDVQSEPAQRTWELLPSRGLSRRDRLDLELLAAAGAAMRLGLDMREPRLEELRELAGRAASRTGAEAEFREELERCHVALDQELWAHSEAEGRAYELGIMLSARTTASAAFTTNARGRRARSGWQSSASCAPRI